MRVVDGAKKAGRHIGRRGGFLAFIALLDLAYGYSLRLSRPTFHADLGLPLSVWGLIWTVVGVVCFVGVFFKRDRIPYATASLLMTIWAAAWIKVWITQNVPLSWVSVIIWLAFAATVLLVAGWPELPILDKELDGD